MKIGQIWADTEKVGWRISNRGYAATQPGIVFVTVERIKPILDWYPCGVLRFPTNDVDHPPGWTLIEDVP